MKIAFANCHAHKHKMAATSCYIRRCEDGEGCNLLLALKQNREPGPGVRRRLLLHARKTIYAKPHGELCRSHNSRLLKAARLIGIAETQGPIRSGSTRVYINDFVSTNVLQHPIHYQLEQGQLNVSTSPSG